MSASNARTTVFGLDGRASRFVASLPVSDPIVEANALVNEAIVLQDQGRVEEAAVLLARAERVLS